MTVSVALRHQRALCFHDPRWRQHKSPHRSGNCRPGSKWRLTADQVAGREAATSFDAAANARKLAPHEEAKSRSHASSAMPPADVSAGHASLLPSIDLVRDQGRFPKPILVGPFAGRVRCSKVSGEKRPRELVVLYGEHSAGMGVANGKGAGQSQPLDSNYCNLI